ncbi:MAG: hypothetical protein ABWY78_06325 [Microvirga sp.]
MKRRQDRGLFDQEWEPAKPKRGKRGALKLDRGQRQGARWHVVDVRTRALYTREQAKTFGVVDGELFQSKREAKAYIARLVEESAGLIRNLRRGKKERIELHTVSPTGEVRKVCSYEPDFLYDESAGSDWRAVVEDVKGWRQDIYKLKKRWLEIEYGIIIRET